MAHEEGGIITAEEARTIATRIVTEGRTEPELQDRYRPGLKEIQRAAEQGYYGVPLLVGDLDLAEFTELLDSKGFRVFQNSTTPEGERTVSSDPQGTIESIEVNWSTFEFTQTETALQRPSGIYLAVKVAGYPLARPLYYTLTGTLVAADFVNGLDQGELIMDTNGESTIYIAVKPGGTRIGKTVQALIYYDSARETLLHAYDEITVIV